MRGWVGAGGGHWEKPSAGGAFTVNHLSPPLFSHQALLSLSALLALVLKLTERVNAGGGVGGIERGGFVLTS